MGLTRLAVRRPVTMLMIIGALILMGLISYPRLPVQTLPNVTFPYVVVITDFPGANPQDIYQAVTRPIENALSGVAGIKQMNGLSTDGLSRVVLQFNLSVNLDTAANDVAQAVDRIQGHLPTGVQTPTIIKANPNAFPIMAVALSGRLNQGQLYNLGTNVLQPELQQVSGVATVGVQGGDIPQVNVTVDPTLLAAYGVSLNQVDQAIAAQNVSVPGGSVSHGGLTTTARTNAHYQSARQLEGLVVASRPTGNVTLGQVSDVRRGYAPITQETRLNGRPAVGLFITAQSGANIVQVDHALKAKLKRLAPQLPPGVKTTIVNDSTVYTYQSLHAVENDLVLAMLLPALVLLFFLHRPRNMLIVMLAIPTSLISTFTVMYFMGFSLDLISLMALSLLTGILVDDSIVILENINRHLSMGKPLLQAVLDGRAEISLAAVAITLTDVVVYAPLAFAGGIIGQFFREYGLTIVVATLFSLFISFTLTPLLASRWLHDPPDEAALLPAIGRPGPWTRFSALWERHYERLRDAYGRMVRVALRRRRRPLVIAIGAFSLLLSFAFIPLGWVGTAFLPQADQSQFTVSVRLPVGTSLPVTAGIVSRLDADIRAMPGVVNTDLSAGARGGFFGSGSNTNTGTIYVDLKPVGQRPPIDSYLARVRRLARRFNGASIIAQLPSSGGGGGGRPVGVVLQGANIHTLDRLAARVTTLMRGIPGLVGVRNEASQSAPELSIRVNRDQAAYFGITAGQIGTAVQTAIAGTTASYLRPNGSTQETPIVVSVRGGDRLTVPQLDNLPLGVPAGAPARNARSGGPAQPAPVVRLGQVATIVRGSGPATLNDQNRLLQVTVDAGTAGVPQGRIAQELRQALNRMGLPPGYTWSFSGAVQQQAQNFGPLLEAFLLAIVLVYMLTSALYESLLYSLAVLFSLPLALVGAMAALAVSSNTLNLYSFLGLIMLMGLVAKNAILLIDYTNTLRARGIERNEALVESGRTRLRPILMTTCTMVFAMLPLALKFGAGWEDRSPVATVLIGGLITSTLLTLVFVPVMYSYLDDLGTWRERRRQRRQVARARRLAAAGATPAVDD